MPLCALIDSHAYLLEAIWFDAVKQWMKRPANTQRVYVFVVVDVDSFAKRILTWSQLTCVQH